MKVETFTEDSAVPGIIEELRREGVPGKRFSDVVDAAGHQYVDLVQEGGGVLGLALVGYTYVLEEMGLRFFGLAGTSAGAINTLLLASHGGVADPKSTWAIGHVADQDLYEFVDGPKHVKKLIRDALAGASRVKMLYRVARSYGYIRDHLGMNPGDRFQEWVEGILAAEGVTDTASLLRKRSQLPDGLRVLRDDATVDGLNPRTVMITSEITTESRVQFPEMRTLFWTDPDAVNPSCYVRASMSVPVFFHPFQPLRVPMDDVTDRMRRGWREIVKYHGQLPEEAIFIDGGIVSNFPIDVFHNAFRVPRMPTFGVKLGSDRTRPKEVKAPGSLARAIFDSARHVHDYEFIRRNADYNKLVAYIDVGDHNWLNFEIEDHDKVDLFERGARAAADFLLDFDWDGYKQIRADLLEKRRGSQAAPGGTPVEG